MGECGLYVNNLINIKICWYGLLFFHHSLQVMMYHYINGANDLFLSATPNIL